MDIGIVAICIGAALSVIGTLLLAMGSRISGDLHEMSLSVRELNTKMAVIIERVEGHDKRIVKLEERE
jgi:outer membrane murein-binding lipoprotein Lpp